MSAEGHDSHSPSLQQCPGSHLTKFNPLRSSVVLRDGPSCLRQRARWTRASHWGGCPTSQWLRFLRVHTRQGDTRLTGASPKVTKETNLHARKTHETPQTTCGTWTRRKDQVPGRGGSQKTSHVWLVRSVLDQITRTQVLGDTSGRQKSLPPMPLHYLLLSHLNLSCDNLS